MIDWVCVVPVHKIAAEVVCGTDHVGVCVALAAVNNDTLGTRMVHPTVISSEDLAATEQPDWNHSVATALGPAPTEWDCWTRQAEQGLLQSVGIERLGTAV